MKCWLILCHLANYELEYSHLVRLYGIQQEYLHTLQKMQHWEGLRQLPLRNYYFERTILLKTSSMKPQRFAELY